MDFGSVVANIDYTVVGERIKGARRRKGISQERLGELIGVAPAYISRIERGSSKINLPRLAQIATALNVTIAELLTGVLQEDEIYLNRELMQILDKCTPEKQKLIYNIARIISEIQTQ